MNGLSANIQFSSTFSVTREMGAASTWDIDTSGAIENVQALSYFLVTEASNPAPDPTRDLGDQYLKIYPAFNEIVTRSLSTAAWDNQEDGSNRTKLDFLSYLLVTEATNHAPDPTRDLGSQLAKFYDFFFYTFDNPPWLKSSVTISSPFTAVAKNPPVYTDELAWIEDNYYTIEQIPYKENAIITPTFRTGNAENTQVVENVLVTDSYTPTLVISVGNQENLLITPNEIGAKNVQPTTFSSKILLHSYFSEKSIQNEMTVLYTQLTIHPTLTGRVKNPPVYINLHKQGMIITPSFDATIFVLPQDVTINENLTITERWIDITSGGSGGEIIVDPDAGDTSGSYADAQEDLQHFIYISPSFHTSETVSLREVLAIATWANHSPNANALLREGLTIRFTENSERHNPNKIEASLVIKDFLKISTEQLANLLEYVRISDHYYTKGGSSDEATITYVVNEGNETTRYEHWPFESYAAFKGMYLGCCADGVYVLSGDNDDGEPIEAMINFGKQSFGSANYKRVPYVYASLAGDGDVYLQVSYNEDEQYMYPARKVDEYNATARFDLGRGIKANYLTFELYNENGSKFDLRNLWIYLTELSRRI